MKKSELRQIIREEIKIALMKETTQVSDKEFDEVITSLKNQNIKIRELMKKYGYL